MFIKNLMNTFILLYIFKIYFASNCLEIGNVTGYIDAFSYVGNSE